MSALIAADCAAMRRFFGNRPKAVPLMAALFAALTALPTPSYGAKEDQALYQDPFDLGAGGASLTRASKDGRLYANPALLPQGGGFHKWLGSTTSILANKESIDTAKEIFNNAKGNKSSGGADTTDSASNSADTKKFVDKVFKDPVRVGWGMSLSWVTSYFGLSVFSRFEPDIRARKFGSNGLPEVEFQAESYHGVVMGMGLKTPVKWLSLGVTGKYVYASEPDIRVDVTDQASIQKFSDPSFVQDLRSHNKGFGADVGAVAFFQGRTTDLSVAAKVDDVGNTKLTGPAASPKQFKQVESLGLGLTFHTGADAIHLAVDYRDIGNAYGEAMFKKIYTGTKVMIRTYLGLSTGFYNGYPSYGAEIDLILLRIAATYYTRELGDHPGVDPRRIYMGSLSFGF